MDKTNEIKKILKYADTETDHTQINYFQGTNEYIELKNNSIVNYGAENKSTILIRVWIKGKEGFSYGNIPNISLLKKAIKIAKLNSKSEFFYGLPCNDNNKVSQTNNYDETIANITPDDLMTESKKLIKNIVYKNNENNNKISIVEGDLQKSISKINILNTNGIENSYETTDYSVSVKTSTPQKSYYDDGLHKTEFFQMNEFTDNVKKMALRFANPINLPSEFKNNNQTIIFNTECFSELLKNAFLDGIISENIINKNSIFIDKLGTKITNKISITDNALLDKGVNSRPIDVEGTPSQITNIIENGKLKNYISDYNTATHLGLKSTGNAYEKSIDFTNIMVKGKYNEINNKSIYVDSIIGAHTSNSLTTDFSVGVERAYIIDGNNKIPVKNFMIAGKMIDFLKNIVSIDKKVIQKNGVYSSSIAVNGLSIN